MEHLIQTAAGLQAILGFLLYVLVSYALPREVIRSTLRKHYRDWIAIGAYWHRNYGKWVIRRRIFYTDEFWGDIVVAAGCGLVLGSIGVLALSHLTEMEGMPFLLLGTTCSTTVLLFLATQVDRVYFIDSEIERRRLVNAEFDPEIELRKLLEGDRRWVKRVLESQSLQR